jgi:hypothetical protein
MKKMTNKKSFFRDCLLEVIEDIIKEYDGCVIVDNYSYNKFENGKWYTKGLEKLSKYKEMIYKDLDIYDIAGEINVLIEGIKDSQYPIIFNIKVKNTNII